MTSFKKNRPLRLQQAGVTLLELLVVVALLAALAFVSTSAFDQAYDETHQQLARSEMQEIVKAIRQFKQDTGYYPGQGPFRLLANMDADGDYSCADDAVNSIGAVDIDSVGAADAVEWFESPANLLQLFVAPVLCGEHPVSNTYVLSVNGDLQWNANTGRGWRGPYLKRQFEFVDVGDGLALDGSGNPTDTNVVAGNHLLNLRGASDPFRFRPVFENSDVVCDNPSDANCLLDWELDFAGTTQATHGRPYLYFLDADVIDDLANNIDCAPCLVSMGINGRYEQGDGDDIVMFIE